ncbi:hypothetical protein CRYUN_Cryun09bG0206900 [Craigia yunnanensis]
MEPQEVIAVALEIVLETKRQEKRRMEESLRAQQVALQEKVRERSMLMSKKQRILAKEAAEEKLIDDFMVLIGAIENNELEHAQSFDEKAMMDTIVTMMNSDGGDNGGFAGGYGDNSVPRIDLGLEEKAMMDAIVALANIVGSCDGDNGGFTGDQGGINNAPENAQNLGDEAMMTATEGTKSDGGQGSNSGGSGGSFTGNRRK